MPFSPPLDPPRLPFLEAALPLLPLPLLALLLLLLPLLLAPDDEVAAGLDAEEDEGGTALVVLPPTLPLPLATAAAVAASAASPCTAAAAALSAVAMASSSASSSGVVAVPRASR